MTDLNKELIPSSPDRTGIPDIRAELRGKPPQPYNWTMHDWAMHNLQDFPQPKQRRLYPPERKRDTSHAPSLGCDKLKG